MKGWDFNVGGGSSGSTGITDPYVGGMQTSGGMTVYNDLGYNPSQPQGGGINWMSLVGSGMKDMGKGIASGETPVGSPQAPQISDSQNYQSPQQPYQPIAQNNLMDILYRLLGG